MPSVLCSLGELEHVYDRQNLKLKTTGFTKVFSSQAFEFPFSLHFQDLEALVSSDVWIAGSNKLLIEIHISFDDIEFAGLGSLTATEDLGFMLCSAEVASYGFTR